MTPQPSCCASADRPPLRRCYSSVCGAQRRAAMRPLARGAMPGAARQECSFFGRCRLRFADVAGCVAGARSHVRRRLGRRGRWRRFEARRWRWIESRRRGCGESKFRRAAWRRDERRGVEPWRAGFGARRGSSVNRGQCDATLWPLGPIAPARRFRRVDGSPRRARDGRPRNGRGQCRRGPRGGGDRGRARRFGVTAISIVAVAAAGMIAGMWIAAIDRIAAAIAHPIKPAGMIDVLAPAIAEYEVIAAAAG